MRNIDATSEAYNINITKTNRSLGSYGFTLVEILVSIAIFAIIATAVYAAFIAQMKHSTREYKIAESEMEVGIARNIIERDLAVTGFGIADDYSGFTGFTIPRVASISTSPYTLTLTGTALGINSRSTQAWSFITDVPAGVPAFQEWNDAREKLRANDYVILMNPSTKTLLGNPGNWSFRYNSANTDLTPALANPNVGTLVYGLSESSTVPTQPYCAVAYSLGGTPPSACAPGTSNLLRAESVTSAAPAGGNQLLACVRDFQVSFGLDTDNNGTIDSWDSDGTSSDNTNFTPKELKKAIKQIKMYILTQASNRDFTYTYPNASVRVGEDSISTGHIINLTSDQRRYRWKLVTISVTPRNF
jgi:prepilin-type N-terminal cleavage/methylation domain-containing protein